MGSASLEATLIRRVVALASIAMLAAAALSYLVMSRTVTSELDRSTAERALAALRMYEDERREEGDTASAMREVIAAANADDVGVRIVAAAEGASDQNRAEMPAAALALSPGGCTSGSDGGHSWHACAVSNRGVVAVVVVSTDAALAARAHARAWVAALIALAILVVAAGTRRTVQRAMQPLRDLAEWSRGVTVGPETSPPPLEARFREIEQLSASFNALVGRLLDAVQRERATSAHIAHELRTAITALRAELESLPDDAHEARVRALGDVERMARVIDAILVLAKPAQIGESAPLVNVADLVREAAPKETSIDAPDEALVRADARLVGLAVRNLIENAERYGGGATRLSVARRGDCVEIAVFDSGPGLDEAARSRMFDRYWRGAADGDGVGVGLALVRAVAQAHGGDASAWSNADERGLCVRMTLGGVVEWHDAPPC
jgi:signal transduction histidine kinase